MTKEGANCGRLCDCDRLQEAGGRYSVRTRTYRGRVASTANAKSFHADPYDYREVRTIASGLGLAEPVAVILVRRGYRTVEQARDFLEAAQAHDPFEFEAMGEACDLVLSVARRGGRVTIHGDYDVDGVCSTAILVSTLRSLGARCDWLIPDRLGDGYGLTGAGVEELRRRDSELVITVDCGIGSAEEVRALRRVGIEVLVTDHHQPPAATELPDCTILHPIVSSYPFEGLCAAGVAQKLATALRTVAGERPVETVAGSRGPGDRDLDLVALATVADLVPLVGENRRLVREGLRRLRGEPRPGLRALMAAAAVDPATVNEEALAFRLAPRINAAGRLYRADAGVELMLTEDSERASQIAAELDRANGERRQAERGVVEAAERARAELTPEQLSAPALVLAGEGWHPGVVGIAASRLAESHRRPAVLISLSGGRGRGSGRSIPGFDLLAALDACSQHLVRHGGHRAAAGLELEADRLDDFRTAFLEHAAATIDPADLVRTEQLDALVGVGRDGIGMDLAEQIERLGPFGKANPGPRLLVPAGRLREVQPLGEDGKHSRFQLESGTGRAMGVAFGMNGEVTRREGESIDLSVQLEVDRWNGAVQPRVVVRELYPRAAPGEDEVLAAGCGAGDCPAPAAEWWQRLEDELARTAAGRPGGAYDARPAEGPRRELVDRRGAAAVAALTELISSGESVLALCADASRRRALAEDAADPRRFGAAAPRLACQRCGSKALHAALGPPSNRRAQTSPPDPEPTGLGSLVLADWGALARRPNAARSFQHVVIVDPPPAEGLEELARAGLNGPWATAATNSPAAPRPFATAGYLHLAWGSAELELARRCLAAEWELRGPIGELWRGLREAGGRLAGDELRELLTGSSRHPRPPEVAARCLAVLCELGLCEWSAADPAPSLRVLSSERTELERSRAYAACVARHQEGDRFLQNRAQAS
jgi:single-stranded-DNA-specific exonuclease